MPENSPKHVETFYAIDLDRTTFDTVGAAEAWMDLIEQEAPDIAHYIHEQIDGTLQSQTSFSIRDAIVERGGEELALKIDEALVEYGKTHNLRLEGANELIDFASQGDNSAAGIFTYGSREGQSLKVRAAGLEDMPFLVTDEKQKGALISSYYKDGKYHLPSVFGSLTADEVVLTDDRVFSFEGSRDDMIGYWLTEEVTFLDDVGHPLNVTPVASLAQVIQAERERRGL